MSTLSKFINDQELQAQAFFKEHYIKLEKADKLRFLMIFGTKISVKELALILRTEDSVAIRFFEEDNKNISLGEMLLSVLGYVLKLSKFNIVEMKHYFGIKGLFKDSENPPPWDAVGLKEYLLINNTEGIESAVVWIQNH